MTAASGPAGHRAVPAGGRRVDGGRFSGGDQLFAAGPEPAPAAEGDGTAESAATSAQTVQNQRPVGSIPAAALSRSVSAPVEPVEPPVLESPQ